MLWRDLKLSRSRKRRAAAPQGIERSGASFEIVRARRE